MRAADRLGPALERLRGEQLFRRRRTAHFHDAVRARVDDREVVCFCSNDYLGLARDARIVAGLVDGARREGGGSGASHLISGHSREHHALEEELADFLRRERAVLFSTGYMANLGTLSALLGRTSIIAQDRLNHASLIDAGALCGARVRRYRHGDAGAAENALNGRGGDAHESTVAPSAENLRSLPAHAIVTDGVFSMDGDLAPLGMLATLARRHDTWLIVDDAHGIGVLGAGGRGTLEELGLSSEEVPVLIGTLGKAFGCFGAFVAGDRDLCEWLVQKARTYIYTTAIPPAMAAAARAALAIIRGEPERRAQLSRHIARFKAGARALNIAALPSSTPIQPLLIGTPERALSAAAALEERGYWVSAIRPPTVPKGGSRLRITLSAAHTVEQIDGLISALAELQREGMLASGAEDMRGHADARPNAATSTAS